MKFNQIKETCLYTGDLKRAEEFYTHILGLEKIVSVAGRHVFFRVGTSVLLIFDPEATKMEEKVPPHFGMGNIHLAFEVEPDDYENSRKKIEDAGVKIEQDYEWPGGFKSFYFRDPDGHLLEIVQRGMWEVSSV